MTQAPPQYLLLPSLLPQFPGSQLAAFFPVLWFLYFLHASILACLAPHAVVSNNMNVTIAD